MRKRRYMRQQITKYKHHKKEPPESRTRKAEVDVTEEEQKTIDATKKGVNKYLMRKVVIHNRD